MKLYADNFAQPSEVKELQPTSLTTRNNYNPDWHVKDTFISNYPFAKEQLVGRYPGLLLAMR